MPAFLSFTSTAFVVSLQRFPQKANTGHLGEINACAYINCSAFQAQYIMRRNACKVNSMVSLPIVNEHVSAEYVKNLLQILYW